MDHNCLDLAIDALLLVLNSLRLITLLLVVNSVLLAAIYLVLVLGGT